MSDGYKYQKKANNGDKDNEVQYGKTLRKHEDDLL